MGAFWIALTLQSYEGKTLIPVDFKTSQRKVNHASQSSLKALSCARSCQCQCQFNVGCMTQKNDDKGKLIRQPNRPRGHTDTTVDLKCKQKVLPQTRWEHYPKLDHVAKFLVYLSKRAAAPCSVHCLWLYGRAWCWIGRVWSWRPE